nr:nitroreductase family protein [Candidatus Freyarchaeota archaeon]
MDVLKAIEKRRSIRDYVEKIPSDEVVYSIIESGRLAPSAGNRQPYRFVVVWDREKIRKIAKASMSFLSKTGVIIVGVADPKLSPKWYPVDTAIVTYGSCSSSSGIGNLLDRCLQRRRG